MPRNILIILLHSLFGDAFRTSTICRDLADSVVESPKAEAYITLKLRISYFNSFFSTIRNGFWITVVMYASVLRLFVQMALSPCQMKTYVYIFIQIVFSVLKIYSFTFNVNKTIWKKSQKMIITSKNWKQIYYCFNDFPWKEEQFNFRFCLFAENAAKCNSRIQMESRAICAHINVIAQFIIFMFAWSA